MMYEKLCDLVNTYNIKAHDRYKIRLKVETHEDRKGEYTTSLTLFFMTEVITYIQERPKDECMDDLATAMLLQLLFKGAKSPI